MTTTDTPLLVGVLLAAALICGLYGKIKGHGFVVPALLGAACFPLALVALLLMKPGNAKGAPAQPEG